MIRKAMMNLISGGLSRRDFMAMTKTAGISAFAAHQLASAALADDQQSPESPSGGDFIALKNATGGKVTCETLRAWNVDYVFGNTGAYEAGFVDALVDYPGIQYVLGLHEGPVMAMADGYARVTGKTAFVNIHSITGAANALGFIVNAYADNSPIVVSVGMSSTRGENLGVFTETAKVEDVAELYTKLSFRANTPANLAESLRRAFRLASATPAGPVFLGIAADLWSGVIPETDIIPAERSRPAAHLHPGNEDVVRAAAWIAKARNPLLVAGAELPRWGGLKELMEMADALGATVSGDTASSRSSLGFPSDYPRYLGPLREAIASPTPFDVVVLAGASRLSLARRGHPLIPLGAKIIEIGVREEHLARNYPVDLLIYADAGETLKRINTALEGIPLDRARISQRRSEGERLKQTARKRLDDQLAKVWDDNPIAPERLAAELDLALPDNALVVTEAVSSDSHIWNYVKFDQINGGRRHVISSGGSLGWGVGAGVGAKLGAPEYPVAVLVGDGGFQFGLQALWTAKRMAQALLVVIFNNHAYQANRWAIDGLQGRGSETGHYIGISLDDPDIDHVGIARAYGADGERVTDPALLSAALKRGVAAEGEGKIYVIDVLIARRGGGALAEPWHE